MKLSLSFCFILAVALTAFSGCATDQQQHQEKPKDSRPMTERVRNGMSKAEVIRVVGNPKTKGMNSDGSETWTYMDSENAFIPFYTLAGGKFHQLTIVFSEDGRVKHWSSNETGGLY